MLYGDEFVRFTMAGEYVVERKCMQSDSSRMSKSNKRARTECEITAKGVSWETGGTRGRHVDVLPRKTRLRFPPRKEKKTMKIKKL